MQTKIIALSGWRGSGKDTVADHLVTKHGYSRVSFAALLKDEVSRMYNLPRHWLDDPIQKERILTQFPIIPTDSFSGAVHDLLRAELAKGQGYWTPRAILILEGSVKRAVHPNYWVSRAVEKIRNTSQNRFVITDMRYKSEADILKLMLDPTDLKASRFDVSTWRINRWHFVDTEDPSERDLDNYKFDQQIYNRGTTSELHKQVDRVLRGGIHLVDVGGS